MASVSPNAPKFGILLSVVVAHAQNENLQQECWEKMHKAIAENDFANWDFLENEVIRLQNEGKVLKKILVCAGIDPRGQQLLQ